MEAQIRQLAEDLGGMKNKLSSIDDNNQNLSEDNKLLSKEKGQLAGELDQLGKEMGGLEDEMGGTKIHFKNMTYAAIFLVFFAFTSSTASWDWIMSIDTHWFSTMFGWYVFASWFVSGLSAMTLAVILLKKNGYMKYVNEEHLHDMGKFMFAFSIFWTYLFSNVSL